MATECSNVKHSAAFPIALPRWFIKLFTIKNDIVLDPFMGSTIAAMSFLMWVKKNIRCIRIQIVNNTYQEKN